MIYYYSKRMVVRVLFVSELVLFIFLYLFGPYGMHTFEHIKHETAQWHEKQSVLRAHIEHIQRDITQWETESFYKEKEAREHLQMAREHEKIYYMVTENSTI
jgi:cell division protein FtsB